MPGGCARAGTNGCWGGFHEADWSEGALERGTDELIGEGAEEDEIGPELSLCWSPSETDLIDSELEGVPDVAVVVTDR